MKSASSQSLTSVWHLSKQQIDFFFDVGAGEMLCWGFGGQLLQQFGLQCTATGDVFDEMSGEL